MTDRDEFRLPPERDVSPELRARVLYHSLSADRVRKGRWRLVAPLGVGLAAAATVLSVVVLVNHDDRREPVPPASGGPETSRPAVQHDVMPIDQRKLEPQEISAAVDACQAVLEPVDRARYVMSARRLRTPSGSMHDVAYGNRETGIRYFCTPYGVTKANRLGHLTSLADPVLQVEDSRVQGLLATTDGSDDSVYYEGTWFSCISGVAAIEARIVVDGDFGIWHRTKRYSEYVFAPVWRTLTPTELDGEIEVQYRAINADNQVLVIPEMKSTTVSPREAGLLDVAVDGLPVS